MKPEVKQIDSVQYFQFPIVHAPNGFAVLGLIITFDKNRFMKKYNFENRYNLLHKIIICD